MRTTRRGRGHQCRVINQRNFAEGSSCCGPRRESYRKGGTGVGDASQGSGNDVDKRTVIKGSATESVIMITQNPTQEGWSRHWAQ